MELSSGLQSGKWQLLLSSVASAVAAVSNHSVNCRVTEATQAVDILHEQWSKVSRAWLRYHPEHQVPTTPPLSLTKEVDLRKKDAASPNHAIAACALNLLIACVQLAQARNRFLELRELSKEVDGLGGDVVDLQMKYAATEIEVKTKLGQWKKLLDMPHTLAIERACSIIRTEVSEKISGLECTATALGGKIATKLEVAKVHRTGAAYASVMAAITVVGTGYGAAGAAAPAIKGGYALACGIAGLASGVEAKNCYDAHSMVRKLQGMDVKLTEVKTGVRTLRDQYQAQVDEALNKDAEVAALLAGSDDPPPVS